MGKAKIIVICGLPVTGKSTLAESIAKELKFPIFSVDPIESAIIKSGIKRSFETGLGAYLVVENLAGEQLKLETSVIIDTVSPVKEARDIWNNLSKNFDADLFIIECVLEQSLHKKRVKSRIRNIHGIAEVSWEDVENRRKEYLEWSEKRLILDSANPVEENLQKSLDYIFEK